MAQYPTRVPANVGSTSPTGSSGNVGYTSPLFHFSYYVTGLPAAVTAVPLGTSPVTGTVVGVSFSLNTPPSSSAITATPVKLPYDAAGTPVNLVSTAPAIASTATGPAITSTFNVNFQSNTLHSAATGVTDAILATGSAVQVRQGDVIGITTSGTFTASAGLCVDVWVREDNGTY